MSTCDVCNRLFLLGVQEMKFSCYQESSVISWLVCLKGFWLRNTSLVKVGNPFSTGCTRNEFQLLSRVLCYSWLVCLMGFWLRNTSLVKVGNPIWDRIVFVFHLA